MAVYTPLPCGHTVVHGAREPAPDCKQCAKNSTLPTMSGDYVMVPREPSKAMIEAGKPWAGVSAESAARTYRAMLSAASPTGGE